MGNGMPIASVVGRRELMERFDDVFFSSTFGGETLSIAAALATIEVIRTKDVIAHLWAQGRKLQDGYNYVARSLGLDCQTQCIGYPPRTVLVFRNETGIEDFVLKTLFVQEAAKRGILTAGGHNVSFAHGNEEVEDTIVAYQDILGVMKRALEYGDPQRFLEGPAVQPIFRRP